MRLSGGSKGREDAKDEESEEEGFTWKALLGVPGRRTQAGEPKESGTGGGGMFIDAAAMKERLKKNMIKPEYDVCNFYKTTGFCQMVARSTPFEHCTLLVIAINAVWIAVDTDLNQATMLLTAHPVFQTAEHFFCAYFTFEWTMRFGAFKKKRNGLRDAWFVFDSFMVVMMVLETWVMTVVLLAAGVGSESGGGGMGDASILRLLRLLRLSRMARMAKLLRSMPELLILIKGMMTAMKSVVYTLMLLAIVIYLFAIAFRQLMADTPAGKEYFSSVFVAMHTLLLDGTFMDSPGDVVKMLAAESIAYVIMFYLFTCVGALMVMNMLIGVLCEVVSAVASTERETIAVATVKDGFMGIIEKGGLDTDGDNMISRREFEALLDDPDSTRLLERVNVDVYSLVDLANFIFTQEDDDSQEKQLTFSEFMEIVLSLRGNNNATVKDVVDLRKFIKDSLHHLEEKVGAGRPAPPEQKAPADGGARSPLLERPGSNSSPTLREEKVTAANGFCPGMIDVYGLGKAVEPPSWVLSYKPEAFGPPSACKAPPEHTLPHTKFGVVQSSSGNGEASHYGSSLHETACYSREAPHAPPLLEEVDGPLPLAESPPVPPGLVPRLLSPQPGVLMRERGRGIPDLDARTKMLQDVCREALRLEGVLASAGSELGRFVEDLPLPAEPGASSSQDRHPSDAKERKLTQSLMPSELRELERLRSRMTTLAQALQGGLADLQCSNR